MSLPLIASSANIFITAYTESDLFGKLIVLSLFFLSVLCWVILVHKIWQSRKVTQVCHAFKTALEGLGQPLLTLDLDMLPKSSLKELPHPFASILRSTKAKTLEILDKNHYFISKNCAERTLDVFLSRQDLDLVESHVLTVISKEAKHLEKHLFILSTITTLAPFLGLLGTVWGILLTFSELHTGASASSSSAVLGGLSTALVTTVLGLVIAIPALIAFNALKASLKSMTSDMENFFYQLLGQIELEYRRVEIE